MIDQGALEAGSSCLRRLRSPTLEAPRLETT